MSHRFIPAKDKGLTWWQAWTRCQLCGKRGYSSRKSARIVRRDQIQDLGEKISDLSVYRCETGLFHLGHPSKVEADQARQRYEGLT